MRAAFLCSLFSIIFFVQRQAKKHGLLIVTPTIEYINFSAVTNKNNPKLRCSHLYIIAMHSAIAKQVTLIPLLPEFFESFTRN